MNSIARIPLLLLAITFACLPWVYLRAEDASPVAADGKLTLLADGFKFTEGPTADAAGNVYFTDQPNDRIMKWSIEGELTTFMQPAGRSNGLYCDASGTLWACADGKNELWKIDLDSREVEVVLSGHDGKLFNGPNDLWVHPAGGVYFTDPLYKRPYWRHRTGEPQLPRATYFLNAKGDLKVMDQDYQQPNGIVGTPDGKRLYVADIGAKITYVYDIGAEGALTNRREFCRQGSDGMTLDSAGNVYLTGKGVQIYNPEGKQIGQVDVPQGWTANVCFGGPELRTLFITASKGLYAMPMKVPGAAAQ